MKKYKLTFAIVSAISIMLFFFGLKTSVTFEFVKDSSFYNYVEYLCFITFCIPAYFIGKTFLDKSKEEKNKLKYNKKLSDSLIKQSHNEVFFSGNIEAGSAILSKEVADTIESDRCSFWLYNHDNTSIVCQNLYIRAENNFHKDIELFEKDFPPYFQALRENPIIVADDAETHPATSCFLEGYLKPLGVKSMLDVPIWYRGKVIGVICIESLSPRIWEKEEVDFAQMLSSLFSFGYSVKESNKLSYEMVENEKFLDASSIISVADVKGKITYVNKRFTDVSGYSLDEVIGKDHNVVNSGTHPKEFWTDMYKTVVADKKIWNAVCTNRAKDGSLYYVDTFIKARFDENNKLIGFSSIRQDVTELKRKETEISNRMNAINRSNAVIEFDLDGNIKFANNAFLDTIGYSHDEIVGKHHSLFVEDSVKDTEEYKDFWKSLKEGNFFSGEIIRRKKNGKLIHLQATYNPIIGNDGKPYRVMKIATDITESFNQQKEIEKKNTYLEHAAKILRHDMHSGINTYMPRGLSSLDRRLSEDNIKELKIEAPIKMIKEGLRHTQKVYKGVYEFTNLVKKDVVLNRSECNLKDILEDYLSATAYRPQVDLSDLGYLSVNEALFCTALDNLIRNGLKYNDSNNKIVKIYRIDDILHVEDNGRGLSSEEFKLLSQPYTRKEGQKESGTGLGLNICIAILEEHGFSVSCDKLPEIGSQIKINLKND
jgi:PAS domain S-box-containing protein